MEDYVRMIFKVDYNNFVSLQASYVSPVGLPVLIVVTPFRTYEFEVPTQADLNSWAETLRSELLVTAMHKMQFPSATMQDVSFRNRAATQSTLQQNIPRTFSVTLSSAPRRSSVSVTNRGFEPHQASMTPLNTHLSPMPPQPRQSIQDYPTTSWAVPSIPVNATEMDYEHSTSDSRLVVNAQDSSAYPCVC
jgi:hypothetical protein